MKKKLTKRNSKKNPFKITSELSRNSRKRSKSAQFDNDVPLEIATNSMISRITPWLALVSQREWIVILIVLWAIAFIYGGYLLINYPSIPTFIIIMIIFFPFTLFAVPAAVWMVVAGLWKLLLGRNSDEKYTGIVCYSIFVLPSLALWVGSDGGFINSVASRSSHFPYLFLYVVVCSGIWMLISLIKRVINARYSINVTVGFVLLSCAVLIVELFYPYPELQITTGVTHHCYETTVKHYAYRSTRVKYEYQVEECFAKFTYGGKTMELFLSGHGNNVTVRNGLVNHYRLSD